MDKKSKNKPKTKESAPAFTKQNAIDLYSGISVLADLEGAKLGYAITKNKRQLEIEMKDLNDQNKQSDDYLEYNKKRLELCHEFAKKDEKGAYVMIEGNFKIEDEDGFTKKHKALKKKYKEALDDREKTQADYDELLKEPSDTKIHMVDFDLIPEKATAAQMDILYYMTREEEDDE